MAENYGNEGTIDQDDFFAFVSVCTFICLALFILYISLVLYYININYKNKKICVFWIDYVILIFGGIFFTLIYFIYLMKSIRNQREPNPKNISTDFFGPALVISLSFMCFTLIDSLLFDAFMGIVIAIKMRKMKSIKQKNIELLSKELNDIDYVDILKMKSHHIYNLVFLVINIILISIETLAYTDVRINRFNTVWTLRGFFDYILRFYHILVLVFLFVSVIIMNTNKKKLLEENYYYNPDRIAQKIYDAHFSQIVYFTDVISFKLVADLIMNIPPMFFMASGKFNTFTLIASEVSIFLYIFFGGSQYFVIDKHSKAGKTNDMIKSLFCLRKSDFHFGEKDVKNILEDFEFDYSDQEKKILKDLNIKIIKNEEMDKSKDSNNHSQNTSSIELQKTN